MSYQLVTKVKLTAPISLYNGRQGLYEKVEHGVSKAGMKPVKKTILQSVRKCWKLHLWHAWVTGVLNCLLRNLNSLFVLLLPLLQCVNSVVGFFVVVWFWFFFQILFPLGKKSSFSYLLWKSSMFLWCANSRWANTFPSSQVRAGGHTSNAPFLEGEKSSRDA